MNWISILEQLPTAGQTVLILMQMTTAGPGHKNSVQLAAYSEEPLYEQHVKTHFYDPSTKRKYTNVTHWQPIKPYEYAGE